MDANREKKFPAKGLEERKGLFCGRVGEEVGGDSRYCFLCSGTVGLSLGEPHINEPCPLLWSGVRPKVQQCWECWWAEVTQSYLRAQCYVAVKNIGFHRQDRQLRNRRYRIGSQHAECFHRRVGPVCAVLVDTVEFAPEWARGPREKAGSPKGRPYPSGQVWESVGSDSCNRGTGLVKFARIRSADIDALDRPDAVSIEKSVELDPVGEGLAIVLGLGCTRGHECKTGSSHEQQEQAHGFRARLHRLMVMQGC
jgi:hypothetical protein